MNQQERAAIRLRIMGLGGVSFAVTLAMALWAKLAVPESSWLIVAVPLVLAIVIYVPTLYLTSSIAIRAEEKRRLRTHCVKCGRELSRPGALRCGGCKRLTRDGYGLIFFWIPAAAVIALFWLVSGWIVS